MADVRVTRQDYEVLMDQTPEVVVYQQFLMVLQGPAQTIHTESITQNLSLNQTALGFADRQNVTDTLNLSQSASGPSVRPRSLSNILNLTQTAIRTVAKSATSNLNVVQSLVHLNFVGERSPAGNVLNLTQTVLANSNPNAESDLNLTQTVDVQYPFRLSVSNLLTISDHTSTPFREFISQDLSVSQFLVTPLPTQHITQNLNLTHESPIGIFEQTLNLSQSVTFSFSLTAANSLGLTHEMERTVIYVRQVEHDDAVGHSLSYYEDSPCGRKNYTPFQGESTVTSDFSAPNNTLQDPQGDTETFSLYTPYLGVPASEITLRKPELDNRDRNAYSRARGETRGGKLLVYSDPIWPNVRTLVVTVIGLTESEVDEFQTFVYATIGQEIGLTDWEGRLWKGFITNPNEPAVQNGRDNWAISFQFEGEMLSVEQPGSDNGDGQTLDITQSVTAVIV